MTGLAYLSDTGCTGLVFRDLGNGIQGIGGQHVGRGLVEMKRHEQPSPFNSRCHAGRRSDATPACGDIDHVTLGNDFHAWRLPHHRTSSRPWS